MKPEEFLAQAELLTGSKIKDSDGIDRDALATILADNGRRIDSSQFNELLLLVHKDRVERPFFDRFFGKNCRIGEIPRGVTEFRTVAMLMYGNFVFAYRTLSRIKQDEALRATLHQAVRDTHEVLTRFRGRRPMLLGIDRIGRELTPYVGYLSAGLVAAEHERCNLLSLATKKGGRPSWNGLKKRVRELSGPGERAVLLEIIRSYRAQHPRAAPGDFSRFVGSSLRRLRGLDARAGKVRKQAEANQNTYLSWDHMDVYFATSMRKAWEYKDLYNFIENLMGSRSLRDLRIRYFDPTQAYTKDRINKGLIEALMLKRARCTVYSVQDTDTLGKDSELASTLAQGKPVIAYIPTISPAARAKSLEAEDPQTVLERLRFLLYADDQLGRQLAPQNYSLIDEVQDALIKFSSERIWSSFPDPRAARRLKAKLGGKWSRFCAIIAKAEERLYDRRAKTLTDSHPLALQVNLGTGVANGVLVVRSVPDCARLLRRVLLFKMEFTLEKVRGVWYLREAVSGCAYRAVTTDRKLSNCFWNFYLR